MARTMKIHGVTFSVQLEPDTAETRRLARTMLAQRVSDGTLGRSGWSTFSGFRLNWKRQLEPGEVSMGAWAHVRYMGRQHLVAGYTARRGSPSILDVRLACGRTTYADAVWHDPAEPHLPRCAVCAKRKAR